MISGQKSSRNSLYIDNSSSILEKIASVYRQQFLCDVTLQVNSVQYPVHRLILCASSDVFQVMLMNPSWSESKEQIIILMEDPACVPIFPDFLRYLYTGRLHLNDEIVLPLLILADKYNVKDLVKICIAYMINHVSSAALNNLLILWLRYTKGSGHEKAASVFNKFILWNIDIISHYNDFGNLDKETLIMFLKSSDLIISEEMELFNFIHKWICTQTRKNSRSRTSVDESDGMLEDNCNYSSDSYDKCEYDKTFYEVISYIRFPMMTSTQVTNLLLHPLTKDFKEYLLERIAVSMAFHSNLLDERMQPLLSRMDPFLFLPRLYTAERWCATLTIDNYHNFPTYGVRTFFFSTPSNVSDHESDKMHEWSVDFYPKGIAFEKFYLIVWQGKVELPEYVNKCVRLSVMSKSICAEQKVSVNIAVLFLAMQNGVEYIHNIVLHRAIFCRQEKVVNIDNLVPYETLNSKNVRPPYFVGPNNDTLKIKIVITPT